MRHMKKLLSILLTCAMLLAITACGGTTGSNTSGNTSDEGSNAPDTSGDSSGAAITIRYGSADAEETAIVQGILAFEKYVEETSNGTIQVEPYINGVLGGDRELCEGLQLGTVDMCLVMGSILANYDDAFNIFGLPYLWDSKQASYDAADGEFGQTMVERAQAIGFNILGYGDGGAYDVGNKGKTVESVADMNGMKLRVPEVDVDINYFTALGATPTPVSMSEAYTALEQGVVTGIELPIELLYCSQYFDALDSITLTGHFQCLFPILISPGTWNSLTADQRQIIMDGVAKQVEVNREIAADAESKYIQVFKDSGKPVHELSDEAMGEFMSVGETIQEQYEDVIGADLIELARSYNK